jgi:hypothetical protein
MANTWFNATGNPIARSAALSTLIRNELANISAAFDRMPPALGAGFTGFQGGTFQSPAINQANAQGGSYGSASNPILATTSVLFLGAGTGYAAGSLPAGSGTKGVLFRMSGTERVGYARAESGGPFATSFFFDEFRGFVMGDGANELATTATTGFLYLPTVNGTPTGAPAAYTGAVPIVYDRSANKLWVRSAGTWRQTAALT